MILHRSANRAWSCAGIRTFDFMVPDFSQLRKQPRGRASSRSLKPSTHKGFYGIKSSQQFDTQPTSTPAGRAEHDFFVLWTTCPSWSPILKKSDGWLTIVNPSGKKVPLVLGAIKSHYRRDYIIGKRFGKLTNYLMIDVDKGSPFHPDNGGIQPILDAMEALGLCRYLLIRSSASGGLHIYFPLAEPVSSWGIACAAHAALTAAGVSIAGGICELFPTKRRSMLSTMAIACRCSRALSSLMTTFGVLAVARPSSCSSGSTARPGRMTRY